MLDNLFAKFDQYCEDHNIQDGEEGVAFAAFLDTLGYDVDFQEVEDDK